MVQTLWCRLYTVEYRRKPEIEVWLSRCLVSDSESVREFGSSSVFCFSLWEVPLAMSPQGHTVPNHNRNTIKKAIKLSSAFFNFNRVLWNLWWYGIHIMDALKCSIPLSLAELRPQRQIGGPFFYCLFQSHPDPNAVSELRVQTSAQRARKPSNFERNIATLWRSPTLIPLHAGICEPFPLSHSATHAAGWVRLAVPTGLTEMPAQGTQKSRSFFTFAQTIGESRSQHTIRALHWALHRAWILHTPNAP